MNVFILGTGRCGTTTFVKACSHIRNYSSGHESRSHLIGKERFAYPNNHIEADNRLSWFLGALDQKYGNNAFYIHLIRDKAQVCESFQKRWHFLSSIIRAFGYGIVMTKEANIDESSRYHIAEFYYDTVNLNIGHFLKDKTNTMTIHLESLAVDFPTFWETIGAEGVLANALEELKVKYNNS